MFLFFDACLISAGKGKYLLVETGRTKSGNDYDRTVTLVGGEVGWRNEAEQQPDAGQVTPMPSVGTTTTGPYRCHCPGCANKRYCRCFPSGNYACQKKRK